LIVPVFSRPADSVAAYDPVAEHLAHAWPRKHSQRLAPRSLKDRSLSEPSSAIARVMAEIDGSSGASRANLSRSLRVHLIDGQGARGFAIIAPRSKRIIGSMVSDAIRAHFPANSLPRCLAGNLARKKFPAALHRNRRTSIGKYLTGKALSAMNRVRPGAPIRFFPCVFCVGREKGTVRLIPLPALSAGRGGRALPAGSTRRDGYRAARLRRRIHLGSARHGGGRR